MLRTRLLLLLGLMLLSVILAGSASAFSPLAPPECRGTPMQFLLWGAPNVQSIESTPVPTGQAWVVTVGGIATTYYGWVDYKMEQRKLVNGVCCWYHPVVIGQAQTTPALALNREIILLPGDRLSARSAGLGAGHQIALLFSYFVVPLSCVTGP